MTGVTIQFVPIPLPQSQSTNAKGRTICKVIGCHRVDYPDTHGYCTQHYGLFFPPVTHLPQDDAVNHQSTDGGHVDNDNNDSADHWKCDCGKSVSSEKKHCGSCTKWSGGVMSNKKGGRRNASSNQIGSSEVFDMSAMPKLPPLCGVPELPPINLSKNRTRGSKRKRASQSSSVNGISDSDPIFDVAISKLKTAKECASCWEALFSARKFQQQRTITTTHTNNYPSDPFD